MMPRMESVSSPPTLNTSRPGHLARSSSAATAARATWRSVASGDLFHGSGQNHTSRPCRRAASAATASRLVSRGADLDRVAVQAGLDDLQLAARERRAVVRPPGHARHAAGVVNDALTPHRAVSFPSRGPATRRRCFSRPCGSLPAPFLRFRGPGCGLPWRSGVVAAAVSRQLPCRACPAMPTGLRASWDARAGRGGRPGGWTAGMARPAGAADAKHDHPREYRVIGDPFCRAGVAESPVGEEEYLADKPEN